MIASHYAEPLACRLRSPTTLLASPDSAAESLANLDAGTEVRILDNSRGWAWGYAAGLVGYVASSAF